MTDHRRFTDEEVAEILERATASPNPAGRGALAPEAGMTLSELKEVGAEVGIDPARIEEAATALATRGPERSPATFLGAARTVSRTVPIPRPLDDGEWDRLVADLRETFSAIGKVRTDGSLRSWNNGNLQIHVEPHGSGWRVRMQTQRGDLPARALTGGFFAVMATLLILVFIFGEAGGNEILVGSIFGAVGLGSLAHTRWMLGGWAEERASQFEGLAGRIPALMEGTEEEE